MFKPLFLLFAFCTIICAYCQRDKGCVLNSSGDGSSEKYEFDSNPSSPYHQDSIVFITWTSYSETWKEEDCTKCCKSLDHCRITSFSVRNLKPDTVTATLFLVDTTERNITIPPFATIEPSLPKCERVSAWGRVIKFRYE